VGEVLGEYFDLREEVTGRQTNNHRELYNLYSSPNIIRVMRLRRMRWSEHVDNMGEVRNVYKILIGKIEGKRPLGRLRHRWEHGIKLDCREIGWGKCGLDSYGSGPG